MALALQTDSTRVISLAFTNLGKENGGLPEFHRDTIPFLIMDKFRMPLMNFLLSKLFM